MSVRRAFAALLLLSAPLSAQDTTTRGVRIGLSYDPGSRPGVVVLPGRGVGADSARLIIQRDLDFGDRINVIVLDASALADAERASAPSWALLAKLGAVAAVQVTPTGSGLHMAVYDVAKQTTALVKDYASAPITDMRAWRASVHRLSDDVEESLTGTRGISATRVLFERGNRLWLVDADGEQATPVTAPGTPLGGAWHPGGTKFAFADYTPPAKIIVFDLLTGRSHVVAAGGGGTYSSPVFTPDGDEIVYAHGLDGSDLYVCSAEGGPSRQLSVGRGSLNTDGTFSPDGRRIAFTSGRSGHPEIYTMDADGTNTDILTPLAFGENAFRAKPAWSPEGRTVAFQSRINGVFQLMTISLRDRSLKQLTSDGRNEQPSWAPDGRHMVFSSDRSGTQVLWVLDTETGRTRQLTRGAKARNPAWSPRLSVSN